MRGPSTSEVMSTGVRGRVLIRIESYADCNGLGDAHVSVRNAELSEDVGGGLCDAACAVLGADADREGGWALLWAAKHVLGDVRFVRGQDAAAVRRAREALAALLADGVDG